MLPVISFHSTGLLGALFHSFQNGALAENLINRSLGLQVVIGALLPEDGTLADAGALAAQ